MKRIQIRFILLISEKFFKRNGSPYCTQWGGGGSKGKGLVQYTESPFVSSSRYRSPNKAASMLLLSGVHQIITLGINTNFGLPSILFIIFLPSAKLFELKFEMHEIFRIVLCFVQFLLSSS